jgi:hypothetical protein
MAVKKSGTKNTRLFYNLLIAKIISSNYESNCSQQTNYGNLQTREPVFFEEKKGTRRISYESFFRFNIETAI